MTYKELLQFLQGMSEDERDCSSAIQIYEDEWVGVKLFDIQDENDFLVDEYDCVVSLTYQQILDGLLSEPEENLDQVVNCQGLNEEWYQIVKTERQSGDDVLSDGDIYLVSGNAVWETKKQIVSGVCEFPFDQNGADKSLFEQYSVLALILSCCKIDPVIPKPGSKWKVTFEELE